MVVMKHLHLFERATRLGITYDDAYRYRHPYFGEERLVDASSVALHVV